MNNEFRTVASDREQCLRRIQSVVDLVQQRSDRSTSSVYDDDDDDKDHTDQGCWTFWLGRSIPNPTILRVPGQKSVLRRLLLEERELLRTTCGCSCANDDWSKIYLMLPEFTADASPGQDPSYGDQSHELKSLVSRTYFDGFVVLDLSATIDGNGSDNGNGDEAHDHKSDSKVQRWSPIPPGLHSNTCVSDSIVSIRTCRVYKNTFLSRTYVGSHAVVINNGHVSSSAVNSGFGTLEITVGAESGGGRSLLLPAESKMGDVSRQLVPGTPEQGDGSLPSSFAFNVVSVGSVVRDTPTVRNVFLHPCSSIEAASSVTNAILFGQAQITNASSASNVCMQWNATISDNSEINNVLLMEHSHCGPSSIVESSVMGPDAHASAGEIHASIFGPNTNAHHQSLLVGVLWPLGRGNVAYGANVGSNHTGRLPDQECATGEGVFWGLSCIAKLPIDLSAAPYSVVAAGTALSPQRIAMPFSLIVGSPSSSGKNEIVPGWVLQHSPYTLVRNDKKYATRRKAKRHADYTGWKIVRKATVERCMAARSALRAAAPSEGTDSPRQSVPGIGDCQLTERARVGGIKAYNNCIHIYALQGLLDWLSKTTLSDDQSEVASRIRAEFAATDTERNDLSLEVVEWPSFPWDEEDEPTNEWEFQRKLLSEEFPMVSSDDNEPELWIGKLLNSPRSTNGNNKNKNNNELHSWIGSVLHNLIVLENAFAERVAKSKKRDDTRGASIVPGYADFHVAAEDDPVVVEVRQHAKATEQLVQKVMGLIPPLS